VKEKDLKKTPKTLIPLKGVLKLDERENPKSNPKKKLKNTFMGLNHKAY